MDFQDITLVGRATADAEAKQSKGGDVDYTTFSVAVNDGKGDKPTYFPITAFGKLGKSAAEYITKGRQVLVKGRIEVSENKRFNVVANRIVFGAQPAERTTKTNTKTKKS